MDGTANAPWTRHHDDPRIPLLAAVPRTVYPSAWNDLRDLLANAANGPFSVAGSHWVLSRAAISDHTFIETHDPHEEHPAMGATLTEVVPRCLNPLLLESLGHDGSAEDGYLVHLEAGKRIYKAYAELDTPDPLDSDATLAGYLATHYGNVEYAGPWASETLGGAGGQTVIGALSTGTHGGDFTLPPLADSVQALHLITEGGPSTGSSGSIRSTGSH